MICFDPDGRRATVVHFKCREPAAFSYDVTAHMLREDGLNFWLSHLRGKSWWTSQLELDLRSFAGLS